MIKKLLFLATAGLCVSLASCDRMPSVAPPATDVSEVRDVPQSVVDAVYRAHPTASQVTFNSIITNQVWEARLLTSQATITALIDKGGTILQTTRSSGGNTLPSQIIEWVKVNEADKLIAEAYEEQGAGGVAQYRLSLAAGDSITSDSVRARNVVLFDASGRFLENLFYPQASVLPISQGKLPTAVQTFIGDNPKLSFFAFHEMRLSGVQTYEGKAMAYNEQKQAWEQLLLVFNTQGQLAKKYVALASGYKGYSLTRADLPPHTVSFLDTKWPEWRPQYILKHTNYTITTGYSMLITKANDSYQLWIDRHGVVAKQIKL